MKNFIMKNKSDICICISEIIVIITVYIYASIFIANIVLAFMFLIHGIMFAMQENKKG